METQVPVHPALAALPAQFDEMRMRLLATAAAIPDPVYNRKPTNGGWSAAQTMEHLLLSASGVANLLAGARTAPAQREPTRQYGILEQVFNNYDQKYPSAENLLPQGEHFEKATHLAAMQASLEQIYQHIGQPGIFDELVEIDLPVFGVMTRIEYIYLVVLHNTRHIRQVREAVA
ncbi:hypothetical protein DCC81_09690 [Chitinophaga parva]|uniref:DinB-like domain-containing protein n=1 Tax=Chitinophaga parva TaxID=2169414 RepID=A0A2T7BPW6_9BACT|nr:DinB family protein [Chitinophaga parva]PUZ29689.1 hypothetical protein DCC81_09690 [Chitinophaga parva]